MNTPLKLAAFGVGLVAVFGAAIGVGSAVGPLGPAVEAPAADHDMAAEAAAGGHDDEGHEGDAAALPAGLTVTSEAPVDESAVRAAVEEAGYEVAGR